ncbi:NPC intracellular cholesterol transporter 1 homolog 1b [Nilaparvata lugens]|uniref:NPC intracellular cholesterol transporter 1 homolog 1b n=1 Tax=Nilaparvata lugens TaxID=108931 RepID=UPI00193E2B3D|nr:NPC intracellular cholesterol transporter 1 homolog 1b [Nilaparvata lugens]
MASNFEEKSDSEETSKFGRLLKSYTVDKLEVCFFRYGVLIGNHPWRFIALSICLAMLCCLGLLKFRQEKHPMKLWIPPESDFARDTDWIMAEFREGYRVQSLLVTAPNVLEPYVLHKVLKMRNRIYASQLDNTTFEDVCFRIPVVNVNVGRRKREEEEYNLLDRITSNLLNFDPSVHLSSKMYCGFVENFPRSCYERSILEFWRYDEEVVNNLDREAVIEMLNTTNISPVYGLEMEYVSLLGGIERNSSGVIVKATSLLSTWMVHINFSQVDMDEIGNSGGTEDFSTGPGMIWEKSFLNTMENITKEKFKYIDVFYESARSFGDLSSALMFQDFDKIILGVFLMFFYVLYVLSTFNWAELKILPTSGGLACVGLAFFSACGLCSALDISYGPVHTSLPFLLMGIGVDDMFVLMACKNNLSKDELKNELPVQIGLTLRHAGISIAITSLTDMIATAIGGTTILPALESFCYFASAGIFMTFVYQCTFFLAFVVLDERRLANNRNSVFPCLKLNFKRIEQKQQENNSFFKRILLASFSNVFLTKIGKMLVILFTCAIFGINLKGILQLKQKFDPKWFLPEGSELLKFYTVRNEMYPYMGQDARIYFGKLNYSADLGNVCRFAHDLSSQQDIILKVESFCDDFYYYANKYYHKDLPNKVLSDDDFSSLISKYLYSPRGSKYLWNFRFEEELKCGEPATQITVASFDFKFKLFSEPEEALYAMNYVKELLRLSNITSGDGFKTVWAKIFAHWVTDEVIQEEMYRNLALACFCSNCSFTKIDSNILNLGSM